MDLAASLPLLCALTLGCGARTGLLVPPPETDAGDSTTDARDSTVVDSTDSTVDVGPEAFDALDTREAAPDVVLDVVDADAPEVIAPIVELALITRDPTAPGPLSLWLADATTGAILRRGPPMDHKLDSWVVPSPDTHHALLTPRPLTNSIYRFDVATTIGAMIPGSDDAAAARWSHDSAHFCIAGAPKAIIVGADATDGGTAFFLPTSGAPSDCVWSHDDASVAWIVGRQIFVTSAAGGVATEVTGSLPTDREVFFAGWSPTEPRIYFFLLDSAGSWRAYTTLVGDPPIEIDDDVGTIGGFSGDGAFVAYARSGPPPFATTLRRAPVSGPKGVGIDLEPSKGIEDGPFLLSPDSTWFAYHADDAEPAVAFRVMVGSFAPDSTIATPIAAVGEPYAWSTRNVLAFIDDTIGAGVSVVDTSTGVASHVGAPLAAGEYILDLAWSPDGSVLAYARTTGEGGGGPGSVCIVTMSDLSERCIPVGLDTLQPIWSTDSTRIAVGAVGGLYLMPLTTMTLTKVAADPGSVLDYWWVRP